MSYSSEDIRNAIRGDATSTLKGFIYQFLVALKACFEMKAGQSVYVEKYGDVAIISDDEVGNISIETKKYQGELTIGHSNILNTLYNWCKPDFRQENYHKLLLFTTQVINEYTDLAKWNDLDKETRYNLISKRFGDHKKKIEDEIEKKRKTDEKAELSIGKKKTIGQIDYLIEESNAETVKSVVGKTQILYAQEDYYELYETLKNQYAIVVEEKKQDLYMCNLLGLIINPHVIENNWSISKQEFSQMLQEQTSMFSARTFVFPAISEPTEDEKRNLEGKLFVKKLRDIEMEEEIVHAIYHYAKTNKLILEDLKSRPYSDDYLKSYQDDLLEQYRTSYNEAKLDFKFDPDKNVIKASQKFYYKMQGACVNITMKPFNKVDVYFSKGMLHILADDQEIDVKWEVR